MSPEQIAKLNAQAVRLRHKIFGTQVAYTRGDEALIRRFSACVSGSTALRELQDAGFLQQHQCTIRFPRTALAGAPLLGDRVTIRGREYVVNEVIDNPADPEWKLGLGVDA